MTFIESVQSSKMQNSEMQNSEMQDSKMQSSHANEFFVDSKGRFFPMSCFYNSAGKIFYHPVLDLSKGRIVENNIEGNEFCISIPKFEKIIRHELFKKFPNFIHDWYHTDSSWQFKFLFMIDSGVDVADTIISNFYTFFFGDSSFHRVPEALRILEEMIFRPGCDEDLYDSVLKVLVSKNNESPFETETLVKIVEKISLGDSENLTKFYNTGITADDRGNLNIIKFNNICKNILFITEESQMKDLISNETDHNKLFEIYKNSSNKSLFFNLLRARNNIYIEDCRMFLKNITMNHVDFCDFIVEVMNNVEKLDFEKLIKFMVDELCDSDVGRYIVTKFSEERDGDNDNFKCLRGVASYFQLGNK